MKRNVNHIIIAGLLLFVGILVGAVIIHLLGWYMPKTNNVSPPSYGFTSGASELSGRFTDKGIKVLMKVILGWFAIFTGYRIPIFFKRGWPDQMVGMLLGCVVAWALLWGINPRTWIIPIAELKAIYIGLALTCFTLWGFTRTVEYLLPRFWQSKQAAELASDKGNDRDDHT
ncbi:MAG: hypothetical protein Alpg2KO_08820 [Alphaproteobacteria bacterium]